MKQSRALALYVELLWGSAQCGTPGPGSQPEACKKLETQKKTLKTAAVFACSRCAFLSPRRGLRYTTQAPEVRG